MTRTTRAAMFPLVARHLLIAAASMAALTGCDGSSVTRNSATLAGGANCPAGSETCACYGNHTCDAGLVCASNLCVAIGNGGATSFAGAPAAGGLGTAGGGVALGGAFDSGGSAATGGVMPTSGGVAAGGLGPSVGGVISLGGAFATAGSGQDVGGAVSLGGAISYGGTVGVAGSGQDVGGAISFGGVMANGGTSNGVAGAAAGGSPAVGGVPNVGGSPSTGGVISAAGQTATGGGGVALTCGNGILDANETCDPAVKNNDMGDGCTPTCMAEPACPATGGPCTSTCGDGLVFDTEECDDGNATTGDGCSATCKIEDGFVCAQPGLGDTMVVPMVVRDFKTGGDFEKGSTFSTGLYYANQGLLAPTLDANGLKPVLASTTGTFDGVAGEDSGIASAASFAQWYNDAATGPNLYNATLATTLNLYLVSGSNPPMYVNRFGTNGDGLNPTQYLKTTEQFCGYVGEENHDTDHNAIPCTLCPYNADPDKTAPCSDPVTTPCQTDASYVGCIQTGTAWYGQFLVKAFDGNPLWFPADSLTPASPAAVGQIPGNYNASWPNDPSGKTRNFSFTTEVRFWFKYDSSQTYKLNILGDDDIWLFINKRLALDMGGIHTPVDGSLTIASSTGIATAKVSPTNVTSATSITSTPDLGGLVNGGVYEIAVFQAERQTKASSYQISLVGFNTARSICQRSP
jgi:fibro-slime domain-containing protein